MGKNLFIISANTLDEFIAEMFSHPTSIKNTNGFKYSYEYFRKYLKDTFPDFTEAEIIKYYENTTRLSKIYEWKELRELMYCLKFEENLKQNDSKD